MLGAGKLGCVRFSTIPWPGPPVTRALRPQRCHPGEEEMLPAEGIGGGLRKNIDGE